MEEEPNERWLQTRVLVCGDRNWSDYRPIGIILNGFLEDAIINFSKLVVIQGMAEGADHLARHFFGGICPKCGRIGAENLNVIHEPYPAEWSIHGKAAGPLRNTQMLEKGKPNVVVAFHDDLANSRGTRNMVDQARKAGVPVWLFSHGNEIGWIER